jgi:hypothetical protein
VHLDLRQHLLLNSKKNGKSRLPGIIMFGTCNAAYLRPAVVSPACACVNAFSRNLEAGRQII